MKIAFVIYPEISLLDLFLLVEAPKKMEASKLQPHGFKMDFCTLSELPGRVASALQSESIKPLLKSSLKEYDIVIMPGCQPDTRITSPEMKRWLGTVRPETAVLASGSASEFVADAQGSAPSQIDKSGNRFETLLLGIRLVERIAGQEVSQKIAGDAGHSGGTRRGVLHPRPAGLRFP